MRPLLRPSTGRLAPLLVLIAAGLLTTLAACRTSTPFDPVNAGRTRVYEAGVPNFDLEVRGVLADGAAAAEVAWSIPYASLVFASPDSVFEARYELLVRVLKRGEEVPVREVTVADTVRLPTYEATQRFAPLVRTERWTLEPGLYVVEATLTDARSDRQAVRRQRVRVPRADGGPPVLTGVELSGVRPGGSAREPLLALHLPKPVDSLQAALRLLHVPPDVQAGVQMRLLRYEADTLAAEVPYAYGGSIGLAYEGVRYERADTLQVSRRTVPGGETTASITFDLPDLDLGVYGVEVEAEVPRAGDPDVRERLTERRVFTVKSPSFPRLLTLPELIDPLVYIAREREMEALRAAETPEELRRRFDAFWGSLVDNRQAAAGLLKRYYERVEEANRRFTSFKAGWKTDRGMVSIVLGPPLYVERGLDEETWFYSYTEQDGPSAFTFERAGSRLGDPTFEHYVLLRDNDFQRVWGRAVQRWRDGDVR